MMNLEGMSLKQLRQAERELTAWLASERRGVYLAVFNYWKKPFALSFGS